jgi:hypothetical protein
MEFHRLMAGGCCCLGKEDAGSHRAHHFPVSVERKILTGEAARAAQAVT